MFSRLRWRYPFDRRASVLHAIEKLRLPLTPPDTDVESLPATESGQIHPSLTMAFLSHTTADEPLIRGRILPVVDSFFANVFFMNIGMVAQGRPAFIIEAYKRRILYGLSNSGWFIVVLSAGAASSPWVRFEFGWALRHLKHRRILALVLDSAGREAFEPVLNFVRTLDVPAHTPAARDAIDRALTRSGARKTG